MYYYYLTLYMYVYMRFNPPPHTHTSHRELVRKKAVMVMHHFHKLSPSSVSHLEDDFRRALSDQDPGVMEAALILVHDLAQVCVCVCV